MKKIPVGLLLVFPVAALSAAKTEPIDVRSAVKSGNVYTDPKFNLSVKLPSQWLVREGIRWGANNTGENTIWFRLSPQLTTPKMYYAAFYSQSPAPAPDKTDQWFLMVMQGRELARRKSGLVDYRNDLSTLEFKKIAGRPAMSYLADYRRSEPLKTDRSDDSSPMMEHFLFVIGKEGFVMFFTQGSPMHVKQVIPKIEQMAASLQIP